MEIGRPQDELPNAAEGEDLTTLSGRLRAAMARAGKRAHYAELKAMLEAAEYEINKQTVHNWFRPSCKFIEHVWLFRVAKVLNVSPEWLATGEGSVSSPVVLSDDHQQAIEMWDTLDDEKARSAWIRSGHEILDLTGKRSRASPAPAAHAARRTVKVTQKR